MTQADVLYIAMVFVAFFGLNAALERAHLMPIPRYALTASVAAGCLVAILSRMARS